MNATQQIQIMKEFMETNYYPELLSNISKGNNFLKVDFKDLAKFNPQIAEILLEKPDDIFKATELAIKEFDLQKTPTRFHLRVKNIPESKKIMIRNIRSEHINKLLWIEGVVRQKTDVRPQVTSARFECPACGNIMTIPQLDTKFRAPTRCSCGRQGKFKLLDKEMVDAQGLIIEEAPEQLEGGEQPKRMKVLLMEDLVSPISDKKTNPGSKILIVGQLKDLPIKTHDGGTSTKHDLIIEGNYIKPIEEDFVDLTMTKEEEEEIKKLAKDPEIYKKMIESVAPSIYGHDRIKEAIIIQLMGGIRKVRDDGIITRGDMHILLIGDPGSGKSQLLKRINRVAPRVRYVTGKGASGAGLTAAAVKDEFMGGWSLEAGALVLANRGFCLIDELDKMGKEDRSAMHEALEQQTVSISKANIQATLMAQTSVLAAANPIMGRFDPYKSIAEQIDLPTTLINRFDLIFPVKDLPSEESDTKLAEFVLNLHKSQNAIESPIETDLLRKYIAYARKNIKPVLSDEAIQEIKNYYVKIRNSGTGEGANKRIPITARQLEGLIRMSEAIAKIRLSKKVKKEEAKKAIDLLHYTLSNIGMDPETGLIDMDRITTGIGSSERNRIRTIRNLIEELDSKLGKKIPIMEVIEGAEKKGIPKIKIEESIQKLKQMGDIFEPTQGFISFIK